MFIQNFTGSAKKEPGLTETSWQRKELFITCRIPAKNKIIIAKTWHFQSFEMNAETQMDSFPEISFIYLSFVDLNMRSCETFSFILTLQRKRARSAGFYLFINPGTFYQNPPPSSPTRNEKLWMKL